MDETYKKLKEMRDNFKLGDDGRTLGELLEYWRNSFQDHELDNIREEFYDRMITENLDKLPEQTLGGRPWRERWICSYYCGYYGLEYYAQDHSWCVRSYNEGISDREEDDYEDFIQDRFEGEEEVLGSGGGE